MELKRFLERVLPASGTQYFTTHKKPQDAAMRQRKHDDVQSLLSEVQSRIQQRHDVYFATGTYKNQRKKSDAEFRKCFFVDLDIGSGDDKYTSKKEAALALVQYCNKSFLTPSIIMDSGHGIHAYWTLDKPITYARWLPIAEALKKTFIDAGVKIDHGVSADGARVMRVLGSTNFKTDTPAPTNLIHNGKDYTLEQVSAALAVPAQPSIGIAIDNDDLSGGVGSIEGKKWYAKGVMEKCPMYKDALDTGGAGLSNALWSNQIHALAYCEDGEDYVHEISKGHDEYAHHETQRMWDQKIIAKEGNSDLGPTTCNTFSKESPHCQDCEFFGIINTPINLSDDRDFTMPKGFGQTDAGIYRIYKAKEKDEDGNVVYVHDLITSFRTKNMKVVKDEELGLIFNCDVINKKGQTRPLKLPYSCMGDNRMFIDTLGTADAIVDADNLKHFGKFMSSWATVIANSKGVVNSRAALGWGNKGQFNLVETVYFADNVERKNLNISANKEVASIFTPVGGAEPWIKIANKFAEQRRYASVAAILTSLASPLLHFLQDSSAIVSFVSSESGTGKTTALQAAQAVWGDPRRGMNQLDDTQNSIFNKLGYLNSLPAYWDEVRVKDDPAKFMKTMFQLTGGREKQRLSSDVKQRKVNTWETILVIASNESMADHAKVAEPSSEAGRVRVFEIEMPLLETAVDDEFNKLRLELNRNYGAVGKIYAKYLANNYDALADIVPKTYNVFSKGSTSSSERFWISAVTVLMVAAQIANKLGLMKVNATEFKGWLLAQLDEQREDVKATYQTRKEQAPDIVSEFMQKYSPQIAIYSSMPTRGNPAKTKKKFELLFTPNDAIKNYVGCVGRDDMTLRVNRRVFDDYIRSEFRAVPKTIVRELNARSGRKQLRPGVAAKAPTYDIKLNKKQLS